MFLVLYVGFSYYHGSWRAPRPERRAADRLSVARRSTSTVATREWAALLICVGILKIGAVILFHSLLGHAHELALQSELHNSVFADGTFVEFTLLPLSAAVLDHLTDIKLAHEGDKEASWMNLIQSTLRTYFFVRPLAALAGHEIDPIFGRMGIGLSFLAIASWFSLPAIPRKLDEDVRFETSS